MTNLTLHDRVNKLAPSATLGVVTRTLELQKQGISVISLSAGEPDFNTPQCILEAAQIALFSGKISHYTPVRGNDDVVDAIRSKFKRSHNLDFSAQEVIATVGGKAAIALAIDSLAGAGDEVIIFSPYWVSFPEIVSLAGATPVFVQCKAENGYLPLVEDFKKAITSKTRAVIINTPNNPTGAVWPETLLRQLMGALEGTGIWVLSDEIYEHLTYDGKRHVSCATLGADAAKRTLIINAVSKAYAMTGWRVGFCAGPKELVGAMVKLQSQRDTCVPGISQYAAAFALRESAPVLQARQIMAEAFEERKNAAQKFAKTLPHVACSVPSGAFFVLLDFSAYMGKTIANEPVPNDLILASRILEEAHVATVAGSPFGAPGTLRISTASSLADIEEGFARIRKWMQ